MTTVLIIEDETAIRNMLVSTMEAEGYTVFSASSAREGKALAENRRADVFLIDLGLPDGDGLDLIKGIRVWSHRPILVLSARNAEVQKVEALDAGADDYLSKPFGVSELHARLRVALRHAMRSDRDGEAVLRVGDLLIDLPARSVSRGAEGLRLTPGCWRPWHAVPTALSQPDNCYRRCGGQDMQSKRITCASTSEPCVKSWSWTPPNRTCC